MPTQQSVGLHNEKRLLPRTQPASQQDQQETFALLEHGAFLVPPQHDQLLAQEGVFQRQLRLAARQAEGCVRDRRVVVRLGPPAEGLYETPTKRTQDLPHEGSKREGHSLPFQ